MEPLYIDENPGTGSVLEAVVEGLAGDPPTLPPWLFYDEEGSRLFDRITLLPEYYLTRTEVSILTAHAPDIAECIGPGATIVEFGSGSGLKTDILLQALARPEAYVAIDVSRTHLLQAADRMRTRFPAVRILPVCADYHYPIPRLTRALEGRRSHVFFPGSTVGNFTPDEAVRFLRNAAALVGSGGGLVIGFDLRKSPEILLPAYDDAAGVTAEFNRNILVHVNRRLGPVFEPGHWRHRATWDESNGRIEMRLVADRPSRVEVDGRTFTFEPGDAILTEYSYKYGEEDIRELLGGSGFRQVRSWIDPDLLFKVVFARVNDQQSGSSCL